MTFTGFVNAYQTDDISALQVSEIPEPSAWALFFGGIGALAMLFWRRRFAV